MQKVEVRTVDTDDLADDWRELVPLIRGRGRRLDLVGRSFFRLTVLAATGRRTKSGSAIWSCRCLCGNLKEVTTDNLMKGKVKSCGCYALEVQRARMDAAKG